MERREGVCSAELSVQVKSLDIDAIRDGSEGARSWPDAQPEGAAFSWLPDECSEMRRLGHEAGAQSQSLLLLCEVLRA